jgi:hypothetical protein
MLKKKECLLNLYSLYSLYSLHSLSALLALLSALSPFSKCVAMTTTLTPRPELFQDGLRCLFLRRIRELEGGGQRNDLQSKLRLDELEDRRSGGQRAKAKKRRIAERLTATPQVTGKRALENLTKAELVQQGMLRGLRNIQGKAKAEIVALCLSNKERRCHLTPESEEGFDTDGIETVWSQVTACDSSRED